MSGFNAGSFEKAKAPNFEKNEVSYEHEEEQYDQQKEYP